VKTDRILLPIDFSDCSRLLVAEATNLCKRLGASLTLLHVVAPPEGLSVDTPIRPEADGSSTTVGRYLVDAAWDRMPAYVKVAEAGQVPVEPVVLVGSVAATIVEQAEAGTYGMVIMGTHGRRGVARVLMGSVAEQVTRRCRVPVMTIRTEHRPDCEARSCQWCASHVMPQDVDVGVELEG
jgi:nucleotide-binding universal stress UspA family protein